jgi:Mg/Co/Ni transporter MgtE
MTNQQELEAIANDTMGLYTQSQKDKATQALSKQNQSVQSNAEDFNSNAELWASYARSHVDAGRRAEIFEMLRANFKNNDQALSSFTPEREKLRALRIVYDQKTWQVVDRLYDEQIAQKA